METVDYISYGLVAMVTIGGIIAAIVSTIRSRARRQKEQDIADSTGIIIPEVLDELPRADFRWVRDQVYLTKMGKSRGDFLVVSTYGIFVLEYSVEKGYIAGRRIDSRWSLKNLAGFGERAFTSPLWQARIHAMALLDEFEELKNVPIYTMAVFPDGTRFSLRLNPWHDVTDDIWEDDDEEEWDDEELENEDFEDDEWEDEEFEDDDEDDDVEDEDPLVFIGTIGDIQDFVDARCFERVLTKEQVDKIVAAIEARSEELHDMDDPELEKDEDGKTLLPEEYMPFTGDYKNYEHIERVNQRRLEEIRARKAAEAEARGEVFVPADSEDEGK